jgi:hypothetical protein
MSDNSTIKVSVTGVRTIEDTTTKLIKTFDVVASFDLEITPEKKLSEASEAYIKTCVKMVGNASAVTVGDKTESLPADKHASGDIKAALSNLGVIAKDATMSKDDLTKALQAARDEAAQLKAMLEQLQGKAQNDARKAAHAENPLTGVKSNA